MKKKVLGIALSLATVGAVYASETFDIHPGWQLLGTTNPVENVSSVFNKSDIVTVWTYDDATQSWKAYSPNEKIMDLINSDQSINILDNIGPKHGFWVNANNALTVVVNNDNNAENRSFAFADNLSDVSVDTLANKNFKLIHRDYAKDSMTPTTLNFNSDGSSQLTVQECRDYRVGESNVTVSLNVVNGALRVKEGEAERDYKILAQNDTGIVFGALDVGTTNDYVEWKGEYLPPVMFLLNENSTENPQNMANFIPYKEYNTWGKREFTLYDTNGSVMYSWNGEQESDDETYTIDDGKISTHRSDVWEDGGDEGKYKLQIVYQIGRYNIEKVNYSDYYYNTVVNYEDENGTYNDLNLTANPDIDTWQELFAKTNWTLYGTKYYDNNKTDSNGDTFSISSDGKTLTKSDKCGWEHNKTIESGKIYDNYTGTWIGITSSTPIYTIGSDVVPLTRKRNNVHLPLNFLPPYIRKQIINR